MEEYPVVPEMCEVDDSTVEEERALTKAQEEAMEAAEEMEDADDDEDEDDWNSNQLSLKKKIRYPYLLLWFLLRFSLITGRATWTWCSFEQDQVYWS